MNLQLRLSAALLVTTTSVAALGEDPKYLMAAMGDSITAGLLAGTSAAPFNQLQSEVLESRVQPPETHYSFPANFFIKAMETRSTLSWATGKNISSHLVLLKRYIKQTESRAQVSSLNVAVTGGLTIDLLRQADTVVKEMATHKYKSLKYVTLLIGNNDACQGNSDENMIEALHETFSRLNQIEQSEPIRILMSGIPKIPDLGTDEIKSSHTILGFTCNDLRTKVTHECTGLTTWTSEEDHSILLQYIDTRNALLAKAADDANRNFPKLNVVFTNRLYDEQLSINHLAIDCFHPNSTAQGKIASDLWKEQPWFK